MQKIPFLVALLGLAGGVIIAIAFGVAEDSFKGRIRRGLERNPAVLRLSDEKARAQLRSSEEEKSWRYYQRYHFHATGIGAMSLGVLVILSAIVGWTGIRLTAAYLVSVGGALYPFVWLFAAIYGPELGRGAAKERFAVFGYMGGLFLVGVLLTIAMVALRPLRFSFQDR